VRTSRGSADPDEARAGAGAAVCDGAPWGTAAAAADSASAVAVGGTPDGASMKTMSASGIAARVRIAVREILFIGSNSFSTVRPLL
jgi:hypothetical protein